MRIRAVMMLIAVGIGLAAVPARANDSTADLATGGLVLRRTADIEMRSEDLYISSDAIRVTYRFRNITSRPLSTIVAFPMPDMTPSEEDSPVPWPDERNPNFLNFATTVDGRPVRTRIERRAVARGVDQTARLRRLGVPLSPFDEAAAAALNRLPPETRAELVALGLAGSAGSGGDPGPSVRLQPAWTLRTTYYWTQVFPPGRDLVVRHRYRPAVGASSDNVFANESVEETAAWRDARRTYCVDRRFLAAMARAAARSGVAPGNMYERRIRYVLVTGANWARPIGDFRMVIDKGHPDAVVSFCGTGVRQLSPTRFEVRYRNYTPRRDVGVLILRPTRHDWPGVRRLVR